MDFDDLMSDLFYNLENSSAYSGINKLYDAAKTRKLEVSSKPTRKRIKTWLAKQYAYTTHFPARKTFRRVKTITWGMDFLFEADLADVSEISQQNGGIKFLLVVCDTFSKFLMVRPLKSKEMTPVADALKDIFEKERKCLYLRTDLGTEFWNERVHSMLKQFGIHHYAARNSVKASQAERYIRTLKSKMFKFLTSKGGKRRYIDDLEAIVKGINNSKHRAIKMKPVDVGLEHQQELFHRLFPDYYLDYGGYMGPGRTYMLKEGDVVRMAKSRGPFYKGYRKMFSEELYIISKIIPRSPPLYQLHIREENGSKGEEIVGNYYGYELKKVEI